MTQKPTYVAGLWKEDLIRGLLWHVDGATLVPTADSSSFHGRFPSWSWASAGYEVVKTALKANNYGGDAVSKIEKVQIDLVDLRDPFGDVKSGSVTITGPLKRLPRLYDKEWALKGATMSKLERHIFEIVDKESQGSVAHKYSSPPGGHFSALQMLSRPLDELHLLVLEATGETRSGISVYRRCGILKLWYTSSIDHASPQLIASLRELEASVPRRLSPSKRRRWRKNSNDNEAYMEVIDGNWAQETVMIV